MTLPEIAFVTGNEKKREEVDRLLEGQARVIKCAVDTPELQGSAEEISRAKCIWAYKYMKDHGRLNEETWVMSEDTCLGFKAYDGLPGPYIKHFLAVLGNDKLPLMLSGFSDHRAEAITTLALTKDGVNVRVFKGVTEGSIVAPRGPRTFGWDPNFEESACGKTYAEMSSAEKDACSHRGKAFTALKEALPLS